MTEIRVPSTESEWEAYYDLRYRILREPLGQLRGSEYHDGDKFGYHFALYDGEKLCAIARLDFLDSHIAQVRFVAVETDLQGKGYGKRIMDEMELFAKDNGIKKMVLHSRDYAVDFYLKLNYELMEPSYKLFDVLQHFLMEKTI